MTKSISDSSIIPNLPKNYCGTAYAAKSLGLSVRTIQILVQRNELTAWKTKGGHRRIAIQSILDYQKKQNIVTQDGKSTNDTNLRILILDNDEITRETLRIICENSIKPVDCTTKVSGMEALMDIINIQPTIFITDLNMPDIDIFSLLSRPCKTPATRMNTCDVG